MDEKLLKIPMEPRHFETWIRGPFMACLAQGDQGFSASGIKDNHVLTLAVSFSGKEKPEAAAISCHIAPFEEQSETDNGKSSPADEGLTFTCPRTLSPADALACFESLFLRGEELATCGWEKHAGVRPTIGIHSPSDAALGRPENFGKVDPHEGLMALKAKNLPALERLLKDGLDPSARIPETDEKGAQLVPLLARYFGETRDLSFALEAVKAFARHGYCIRAKKNTGPAVEEAAGNYDIDYDVYKHAKALAEQDGLVVFSALSIHQADPQYLTVWKALLETDLPFAYRESEQRDWYSGICLDVIYHDTVELNAVEPPADVCPLYCARIIAKRFTAGLPFDGVGLPSSVVGRRLMRILLARAPRGEEPELYATKDMRGNDALGFRGCIVLDFEGVFVVDEDGESVYTDTRAPELFPDMRDVSDRFPVVIGKRLLLFRFSDEGELFTVDDPNVSCYCNRHAFVFEGGTLLYAGDRYQGTYLRCLKRNWGEFLVTAEGKLEKPLPAEFSFWDAYEIYPDNSKEYFVYDIPTTDPVFSDAVEQEWEKWWTENRQGQAKPDWMNAMFPLELGNPEEQAALRKIFRKWLDRTPSQSGPDRAALPFPYRNNITIAAHELEDLPTTFADALGLVWSEPMTSWNRDSRLKEGVKLTKPIEEANAVAQENGWLISFRPA